MAPAAARRVALFAAFDATVAEIGSLPSVWTDPFAREGQLFSIVVDPDACKGCGLCVAECLPLALTAAADSPSRSDAARSTWRLWERLPDTAGATVEAMQKHPDIGPIGGLLLSRHCSLAMAGGDLAEPGSGERLAIRLVLCAAEFYLQRIRREQQSDLGLLRTRLGEAVREALSRGLPPLDDLDGLATKLAELHREDVELKTLLDRVSAVGAGTNKINASRVARLVEALVALGEESWHLETGPLGRGRARLGLVLADGRLTRWAGAFPFNPFGAPTAIATGGEAGSVCAGVLEGQLAIATEGARRRRQALLELDSPQEANLADGPLGRPEYRDLDGAERRFLPPVLLIGDEEALARDLGSVMALLDSGLPVKILLCGASSPRLALAVLTQRTPFVAHTSVGCPAHLGRSVLLALAHDGPALISIHAPSPAIGGFRPDQTLAVARDAVAQRLAPLFVYDPAAGGVFGERIDLSGNPNLAAGNGDDSTGTEIWRMLLELAGVVTPFTNRVRALAEAEIASTHEALLATLNVQHKTQIDTLRSEVESELIKRVRERLLTLAGYGT